MREMCFPLAVDETGSIAYTTDLNKQIQQRVRMVVGTNPGERVMRPEYGTPTRRWLWESMNENDEDDLKDSIRERVNAQVPEVTVTFVELTRDEESGTIEVNVRYTLQNGLEDSSIASLGSLSQ